MKNDKYVVFKRDAWDREKLAQMYAVGLKEVPDAVVIRLQDAFAAPALDAYANAISVALKLLDKDNENYTALRTIADYFHEAAAESWQLETKVPD